MGLKLCCCSLGVCRKCLEIQDFRTPLLGQSHPTQKVAEARVGAKSIKSWIDLQNHPDFPIVLSISPFQPLKRSVLIAELGIVSGYISWREIHRFCHPKVGAQRFASPRMLKVRTSVILQSLYESDSLFVPDELRTSVPLVKSLAIHSLSKIHVSQTAVGISKIWIEI